MRIIFICGTLEPGKDGVGDYTRRLCAHIIKSGIQVAMLALNDKFANVSAEERQHVDNEAILCYRIPSVVKPNDKNTLAKSWIDHHNPEWLSLQFVPYAFHNKGLPFGLPKQLKHIGIGKKWHIMFHELWIGMSVQSSKKEWLIGNIQKKIIKKILSRLEPKCISTQTQLYYRYLNDMCHSVNVIPLFSNIPVVEDHSINSIIEGIGTVLPEKYIVVFGSIHTGVPIDSFIKELRDDIVIVCIGRNGSQLDYWEHICEKHNKNIIILGEQESKVVSAVLKKAILGLSTTPPALIEKSGALAAKHAHKLPVICVSKTWQPRDIKVDWTIDGVEEYKLGTLNDILKKMNKNYTIKGYALKDISKLLLTHLKIETYG